MYQLTNTKPIYTYLILCFYIFNITCCCNSNTGFHKVSSPKDINHKKVTHTIIGDCKARKNHIFVEEFSASDVLASELKHLEDLKNVLGRNVNSTELQKISPATRAFNTHGFIFDNSISSIHNKYIEGLLKSREFIDSKQCIGNTAAKVNDIVIYKDEDGLVVHSGEVISTKNFIIRVRSKWGHGPTYEHNLEIIPIKHESYSFYRKNC